MGCLLFYAHGGGYTYFFVSFMIATRGERIITARIARIVMEETPFVLDGFSITRDWYNKTAYIGHEAC